jgi:cytoskeletal protein CcmA (bactofilin family)
MLHLASLVVVTGSRPLADDLAAQRRGSRVWQEASMFGRKQEVQETTPTKAPTAPPVPLLTIVGDIAKIEGKFQIADSIQIECEVGGELRVGGKLIIGEKGVVNADVETVDAIVLGHYDGNMVATGNVEIAATGRVSGNIKTDSLVISKGGCFRGNVAKITEETADSHRPLYLVDDKLAGQIGPR